MKMVKIYFLVFLLILLGIYLVIVNIFLLFHVEKRVNNFKNCSVIHGNAKQFQVEIDGVIYPKKVPLRDNSSIDFECINRGKDLKLILL